MFLLQRWDEISTMSLKGSIRISVSPSKKEKSLKNAADHPTDLQQNTNWSKWLILDAPGVKGALRNPLQSFVVCALIYFIKCDTLVLNLPASRKSPNKVARTSRRILSKMTPGGETSDRNPGEGAQREDAGTQTRGGGGGKSPLILFSAAWRLVQRGGSSSAESEATGDARLPELRDHKARTTWREAPSSKQRQSKMLLWAAFIKNSLFNLFYFWFMWIQAQMIGWTHHALSFSAHICCGD